MQYSTNYETKSVQLKRLLTEMETFQQNCSGINDWWHRTANVKKVSPWKCEERKRVVKVNRHFYRFTRSWLCQEEAPRGNQRGGDRQRVQDCNIFLVGGSNIFLVGGYNILQVGGRTFFGLQHIFSGWLIYILAQFWMHFKQFIFSWWL